MIVPQSPPTSFALKGHDFTDRVKTRGFERARLQPCRNCSKTATALALEGYPSFPNLFLLLCLIVLLAAPAAAQDFLNCHLVPGWEQSGTKREYTPNNLYDYKDGAAEGYLVFDFARMQGIDCQSGTTTLAIDVSDMTEADLAYGMFAANRDPKEAIAKIGMGGQVLAQSAMFAKGRYFVEIVETDGNSSSNQAAALKAFAAKIELMLAGRNTPPDALKWFPTENQIKVKLVPESVLGLKILKRGYVAQYENGQAFVVSEESPQAAAEVMNKLRERFEGTQPEQIGEEAFQVKAPYLDGVCVFRRGRYIGGYANLPEPKEAAALAAKLIARIP